MSGYIMPPRLRPSDYIKGKITQDDLLRVAIANDANIAKARKDLKWSPKTTLYEGLKKTIIWYKKTYDNY